MSKTIRHLFHFKTLDIVSSETCTRCVAKAIKKHRRSCRTPDDWTSKKEEKDVSV